MHHPRRFVIALLVTGILLLITGATDAQTEQFTGYMGDDVPDARYPVELGAGQTVTVSANATSGNLDTVIKLEDSSGEIVAENDDRSDATLDSAFTYVAEASGEYTVIVSNYPQSSGEYILRIKITGRGSAEPSDSSTTAAREPDEIYTGYMGDDVPDDYFSIRLEAGQAVIATAERVSGDLDPYLLLEDHEETIVAENDDQDAATLDSELIYIAPASGEYTLILTNIQETSGDYRLSIIFVSGEEAEADLRVTLSGAPLTYDTEHFRIHYTLEGDDATTEEYAHLVAETLEEVRDLQINQLGWPAGPIDGAVGGDDRYDVYLVDLLDDYEGGDLGSTSPELPAGDNPNTILVEEYAVSSYIILDNDYAEEEFLERDDSISLMRATAAHEFHHAIQFGYDLGDRYHWYYEATASWMETMTVPDDEDASGYVEAVYTYPEICFGAEAEADPTEGLLMYGQWLFIQSLVDAHGAEAIQRLWENIALSEGWQPLEDTLAHYGDTLQEAVTRYHLHNLVRDYALTPSFADQVVWLENTITKQGRWSFTGQGIQELGANYFRMELPGGVYRISMTGDNGKLELWVIGIKGTEAAAIPIGRDNNVDTQPYKHVYLMVFNADYDDDVEECDYVGYTIEVQPGDGPPAGPAFALDAGQFSPPN